MDTPRAAGLAAAAGYLLGSIPFAWMVVRARAGVDLRTVGSGNVGATNASRVLGRAWFFAVFALDFGKGAAAVLVAEHLFRPGGPAGDAAAWVPPAGAAGALLGHMFPFALGFRGGKGVATGAGVVAPLAPLALAVGLAAFGATAAISRFVSLGSVVAALATTAAYVLLGGPPEGPRLPAFVLLAVFAALVLVRHVPNFRRIAAGTEPRIGEGAPPPPAASAPAGEEARGARG